MRIVASRMPVPRINPPHMPAPRVLAPHVPPACGTSGAASCLESRSPVHFPESSRASRPFRFHAPQDSWPEGTYVVNLWPDDDAPGPVRATRLLQTERTPPYRTHCHIPLEGILHGRPQRIRPARRAQRRTLRRPGGMHAGARRSMRRCRVIHRHHSRFPPSVIVSADGRRDRFPVRAFSGPRVASRFPARTGAGIRPIIHGGIAVTSRALRSRALTSCPMPNDRTVDETPPRARTGPIPIPGPAARARPPRHLHSSWWPAPLHRTRLPGTPLNPRPNEDHETANIRKG